MNLLDKDKHRAGVAPRLWQRAATAARSCAPAAAILLIAFVVYALSPISIPSDSMWSVPVAQSILDRHTTNLDFYRQLVLQNARYGVHCVDGAKHVRVDEAMGACLDGHIYNSYPIGVPVLAVPVLMGMHAAMWAVRPLLTHSRWLESHPAADAMVRGDFVTAYALVERVVASFLVALAAAFVFLFAREWLAMRPAAVLALLFAFGTPAWSTASRVLWQHGPSMLAIAATMYLLVRGRRTPWMLPMAGFTCACAYTFRPTNSLWVMLVSGYVLWCHPRQFWKYLLCAAPVAAAFLAYDYTTYGKLLSAYYEPRVTPLPWSILIPAYRNAMAGTLVSPSRGLLVYSPMFLFSFWGLWLAVRQRWELRLSLILVCYSVGLWLVVCLPGGWWDWFGGWCYGPRMLSDLSPILIFFLIPVFRLWHVWLQKNEPAWRSFVVMGVFTVLAAISCVIHSQGALTRATHHWNEQPAITEQMLWDWRDPQFLRGFRH